MQRITVVTAIVTPLNSMLTQTFARIWRSYVIGMCFINDIWLPSLVNAVDAILFIAVAKNARAMTATSMTMSARKSPLPNVSLNALIESAVAGILNNATTSIGHIRLTTTQYFLYAGVLTSVFISFVIYDLNGVFMAKSCSPTTSFWRRPDLPVDDTRYTPLRYSRFPRKNRSATQPAFTSTKSNIYTMLLLPNAFRNSGTVKNILFITFMNILSPFLRLSM